MSKPIRCPRCHRLVGTCNWPLDASDFERKISTDCDFHREPIKTKKRFGWFWNRKTKVTIFYPETGTTSEWEECL